LTAQKAEMIGNAIGLILSDVIVLWLLALAIRSFWHGEVNAGLLYMIAASVYSIDYHVGKIARMLK